MPAANQANGNRTISSTAARYIRKANLLRKHVSRCCTTVFWFKTMFDPSDRPRGCSISLMRPAQKNCHSHSKIMGIPSAIEMFGFENFHQKPLISRISRMTQLLCPSPKSSKPKLSASTCVAAAGCGRSRNKAVNYSFRFLAHHSSS